MSGGQPSRAAWLRSVLTTVAVAYALSFAWNMPPDAERFRWTRVLPLSVEIAVLFTALALVPRLSRGRLARGAAVLVAVATSTIVAFTAAEMTVLQVLDRPFNPLLDARLATAVVDLLTHAFGALVGWSAVILLGLAPLLIGAATFAAVRSVQRALHVRAVRNAVAAAGGFLLALFAVQNGFDRHDRVVDDGARRTFARYAQVAAETARVRSDIEAEIAHDRFESVPSDRMLAHLRGVDVLLLFVESYGRSALELPRYATLTGPTLAAFEQQLAAHGLSAVSGWLTSPSAGGQSWLPTGTLTNGLWLADQARYDTAMESERLTLVRAFTRAGYRTVALKPAVTRPWPEGARMGFGQMYVAGDLGYAGKPYNWITMPDQYTLSVLQRTERQTRARPLFAEVSLISSHWPWTPIAPVLDDWGAIGDGHIFSTWADSGDPEPLWSDPERIRVHYGRAVDYVLKVLSSYVATFADDRTLVIVVGDHQPARVITGDNATRDVPMHVISGDRTLLAPFRAWGFAPGMRPARDLPAKRMDSFRDFFLEAFSTTAVGTASAQ